MYNSQKWVDNAAEIVNKVQATQGNEWFRTTELRQLRGGLDQDTGIYKIIWNYDQ
jgi:hypothetical protein